MTHRWSERDHIAALYLYKFGRTAAAPDIDDVAQRLGISGASMRMRTQNFRAIDTGEGLENFAQQSLSIHTRYGAMSRSLLNEGV